MNGNMLICASIGMYVHTPPLIEGKHPSFPNKLRHAILCL